MKSLISAVIVAAAIAAPAISFAQSNQPVTRAEVKAELAQLEQAGYNPSRVSPYYPADLQAAQARVAANQGAAANSGYGAPATGSSNAGRVAALGSQAPSPQQAVFFGH